MTATVAAKPRSYGNLKEAEDDDYYEELIIEDDDDDDYIEEVIDDDASSGAITPSKIDGMSFQNAKNYLKSFHVPADIGGKSKPPRPPSAPVAKYDSDDDYEEYVLPDEITPIRLSQRLSLFAPPDLDNISEEEGSVRSQRSASSKSKASFTRTSSKGLTSGSPIVKREERKLSNLKDIQEEDDAPNSAKGLMISPVQDDDPSEHATTQKLIKKDQRIPEGTIGVVPLNDTEGENETTNEAAPNGSFTKRSSKSLTSETTEATEATSFSSLDGPPAGYDSSSPHSTNSRKRAGSYPKSPEARKASSDSALGKKLSNLGRSPKRTSLDDKSAHSSRSARSSKTRSKSGGRRRRSSMSNSSHSVEDELMDILNQHVLASPIGEKASAPKEKSSSLSNLGDLPSEVPKHKDGDAAMSRSSHSRRSRSSRNDAEQNKKNEKGKPSLDDLLSRMSSEPSKRIDRDAQSTFSAMKKPTRRRGRTEDDRDCQSVVDGSTTRRRRSSSLKKKRSNRVNDSQSVSSISELRRRARSASVGRKERLRRRRHKDESRLESQGTPTTPKAPRRGSVTMHSEGTPTTARTPRRGSMTMQKRHSADDVLLEHTDEFSHRSAPRRSSIGTGRSSAQAEGRKPERRMPKSKNDESSVPVEEASESTRRPSLPSRPPNQHRIQRKHSADDVLLMPEEEDAPISSSSLRRSSTHSSSSEASRSKMRRSSSSRNHDSSASVNSSSYHSPRKTPRPIRGSRTLDAQRSTPHRSKSEDSPRTSRKGVPNPPLIDDAPDEGDSSSKKSAATRLKEAKELLELGMITEEEYYAKRGEIIQAI